MRLETLASEALSHYVELTVRLETLASEALSHYVEYAKRIIKDREFLRSLSFFTCDNRNRKKVLTNKNYHDRIIMTDSNKIEVRCKTVYDIYNGKGG